MSGDTININVTITSDGSEARLFDTILAAVKGVEKEIGNLGKVIEGLSGKFDGIKDDFDDAVKGAQSATRATRDLGDVLENVARQAKGVADQFGDAFDPGVMGPVSEGLRDIAGLEADLRQEGEKSTGASKRRWRIEADLAQSQAQTNKTVFSQTAQANRESQVNQSRETAQQTRFRTELHRSETSRIVAATQAASAEQLASIRSTTRLEVAETQSAARRRVAIMELAGRAIVAIERSIRAAFTGTAKAIGLTFRGLGRVASTAASGVRKAFTRSNKDVQNSYSQTWNNNTRTVQNNLNKQSSSVKNFAAEASSALGGISPGGLALGGILGLGAAKALRGGFDRAATLEDSERALTILLGDAKAAADLRDEILKVVTGTPFKLDQFADGAAQLAAFGVEAEKIPAYLQSIGDAASVRGGNAGQTIDTLIRVFGQVTTASRISLEDINSISEAGVPALKILGNAFGETAADIRDMISEGAIPAEEALQILTDGIQDGTDGVNGMTVAFAGMAQGLGETLRGRVANFGAAFDRLGEKIFTQFRPLISKVLETATTAVDLFGTALASLINSVKGSPIFTALVKGFTALNEVLVRSKELLKPAFDVIAEGIVAVGTAFLAFKALKNIPGLFSAVAFAMKRLFTPMHLLVGAGILVVGFFKKMIDESPSLRIALENLGRTFSSVVTPLVEALALAFAAVAEVVGDLLEPVIETLSDLIVSVAVPALAKLDQFIRQTIIPAIKEFADWITGTLAPAVGEVLVRGIEIATTALSEFAKFLEVAFNILVRGDFTGGEGWLAEDSFVVTALLRIRQAFEDVAEFAVAAFEIITQGGTTLGAEGWLAYDGPIVKGLFRIREAFKSVYSFLSDTFVPFIQNNLIPVLGGLAAALGLFALTGSLPLAGLVAGIGLAVAAFQDDDIAAAIVETVKNGVDKAKGFLENLVDSRTLAKVGVGILKVANEIGRVLGNIATDPRLLGAIVAIAAAGVAVGAAFLAGVVEGVASNIPEAFDRIGELVTKGFIEIFKAAASNPLVLGALVAIIGGGVALARLIAVARRSGAVLAQGLAQGIASQGTVGANNKASGFLRGLFGGPDAIAKAGAKAGAKYAKSMSSAIARDNRLTKSLTGRAVQGLTQTRGDDGRFGTIAPTNANLKRSTGAVKDLDKALGAATVSGQLFRLGLGGIKTGLRNLFTGGLKDVKTGLGDLGAAFRRSGPQIATAAGAIAGGAFMASFVSKALFDLESSGADKLQAGIGLAATGLGVFAATGSVTAGVAAVGIGTLVGAFQASAEAAKKAAAAAKEYALALVGVTDEAERAAIATDTVWDDIKDQSSDVRESLEDMDFNYRKFSASVADGTVDESFGSAKDILLDISLITKGLPTETPIAGALQDADVTGGDLVETLKFISGEISKLQTGATQGGVLDRLFEVDVSAVVQGLVDVVTGTRAAGQAADIANAATDAYKAKLKELNDERLNKLKERVDETKTALNEAATAADDAKDAVIAFLTGKTAEFELEREVNKGIVAADNLADSLAGQFAQKIKDGGPALEAAMSENMAQVRDIAEDILSDGEFLTQEDAAAALGPIIEAAYLRGDEAGAAVATTLNQVLENYKLPEGTNLLDDAVDTEATFAEAQIAADNADLSLGLALDVDPETLPGFELQARAAGTAAGNDTAEGFGDALLASTEGTEAVDGFVGDILDQFGISLITGSPSEAAARYGRFTSAGYALGMVQTLPAVKLAAAGVALAATAEVGASKWVGLWLQAGRNMALGLAAGITSGTFAARAAATAVANAATNAADLALENKSPSKVAARIGVNFSAGLAVGITSGARAVNTAVRGVATSAAKEASSQFVSVGKAIGKAISQGLADEGFGVLGTGGTIVVETKNAVLSDSQIIAATTAEVAAALLAGGSPTRPGLGTSALDVANARLDTATIFRDVKDANAQLAEDIMAAAIARNEGTSLTAVQKALLASPNFQQLGLDSVAGQINQAAFLEAGASITSLGVTLLESGQSFGAVSAEMKRLRDGLIATGLGLGFSNAEMQKLVQTLGLTDAQLSAMGAELVKVADEAKKASQSAADAAAAQEAAAEAAKRAEEAAEKAAEAAEKAAEAEEKRREEAEQAAADALAAERAFVPPPVFNDLIIQVPTGDPEAIALATANRVAFSVRR